VARIVLAGACWGLTAFGALQVADLPGEFSHALCGPWGCLPPVQALAAMHLFWFILLVPASAWLGIRLRPDRSPLLGPLLLVTGGVGIAVFVGRDLLAWLAAMPPDLHGYWARRALVSLALQTDLPLVQVLLAGALCWMAGRARRRNGAGGVGEAAACRCQGSPGGPGGSK
jgi:hypothetical protein